MKPGYEALWGWFGLSRASFCVMARVMMHAMPDEWQGKMVALLEEFDEEWPQSNQQNFDGCTVSAKKANRFVAMPSEITNYRHPDTEALQKYRANCNGSATRDHVKGFTAPV